MNRQLSAAVIASFRDADPSQHRKRLHRFSARQWHENFRWLDASGLALYFLQRLRSLEAENAIPDSILAQLEQRHADNEHRTAVLFNEFVRINAAFRGAGLEFVALKGFSLVPDFCPDLSLRCQMDFDLLIADYQAGPCRDVLVSLGYSLMASNSHVLEFKSNAGKVPHMRDLYKAKPQHAVEIHLSDDSRFEFHSSLLNRSRIATANGIEYPALSAEDMFFGVASHLFRHIRSEWTRISWLLELRHFLFTRRNDSAFWTNVRENAQQTSGAAVAVGVAVSLADKAFGKLECYDLRNWSVDELPAPVILWIEHYGDKTLLADFPGSKLYLLLERELDDSRETSLTIRQRLFPTSRPARIATAATGNILDRLQALQFEYRYFFFRLRFHLTQTPRYLLEAWLWKRSRKERCEQGVADDRTARQAAITECEAGHKLQGSYPSLTVKQQ
jgi:hypothetical protein